MGSDLTPWALRAVIEGDRPLAGWYLSPRALRVADGEALDGP